MQISERRVGDVSILILVGELTYVNRGLFTTAVERTKQAGCRHLVLDLQAVRFLDSSAIGMLVLLAQNMKASHGTVILSSPQSYIREILALANLDRVFPIYKTLQEALMGERLPTHMTQNKK